MTTYESNTSEYFEALKLQAETHAWKNELPEGTLVTLTHGAWKTCDAVITGRDFKGGEMQAAIYTVTLTNNKTSIHFGSTFSVSMCADEFELNYKVNHKSASNRAAAYVKKMMAYEARRMAAIAEANTDRLYSHAPEFPTATFGS